MVQTTDSMERSLAKRGCGNYWKLGPRRHFKRVTGTFAKEEMRAGGYFFKKSDKAERSVALYYRMQRGLLSYDGCSVLELRKFVEGRGIVVDLRKAKKDNLVKALEAADDAATFDKLMDLPAELRVAICEFHFESFPALPLSPHQPPLLLASSHIRRETLPVFYSSSTFQTVVYRSSKTTSDDVQVDSEEIRATLAEESVPKPRLSLDRILEKNVTSRTKRFMTHTPAAHLSQIKRLSLQTFYHGWWEIDISKRRNDQMVSCFVEAAQPLNGPSERNKGEMSKIEVVLKAVAQPDSKTLMKSAIAAVAELLQCEFESED